MGDVYPASSSVAGTFGDQRIDTLDLLAMLRAVAGIPGAVPAVCSDLFDALDVSPADTQSTRGGDGVLNTLDLLLLLRRVSGVDTSQWTRAVRGQSCNAASPFARAPRGNPEGSLELEREGNLTAIYLRATTNLSLSGLAFSLGTDDDSRLGFVAPDDRYPTLMRSRPAR